MRKIAFNLLLAFSIPILTLIALAGWRVDVFQITDSDEKLIFQTPVSLGHKFTTRYIHSVELTPVEDEYRIVYGQLWTWEERVRSTNAGLPFDKPRHGRFLNTGRWMIFQGGRMSWKEYYYRVGNKSVGRNQFALEPLGLKNFYELYEGERLTIRIAKIPFYRAEFYRAALLEDTPAGTLPEKGDSR